MENTMGPCGNGFVAEHPSRENAAYGRLVLLHGTNLHGGGMCTQGDIRILFNEESILHIPGRMLFREIQGRKIVPVIFDLPVFGNRISDAGKDLDDLVSYDR